MMERQGSAGLERAHPRTRIGRFGCRRYDYRLDHCMTPDDSMQHNQGHLTRQWMVMQSANQVKHISAILRYDPTGLKCGAARPTLCSQEARTNRSPRLAGFQNTAGLPCRILMLLGYIQADSTRCASKLQLPFHRNKSR